MKAGIASQITIILTKENVPTPAQSKGQNAAIKQNGWNTFAVGRILKHPCYYGEPYYANQDKFPNDPSKWVEVKYPKLISKSRWNLIQEKRKRNTSKWKRTHKGLEKSYLTVNTLRCGICGAKMVAVPGPTPKYKCYWANVGKKSLEAKGKERCSLPAIDAETVDKRVLKEILFVIANPVHTFKAFYHEKDPDVILAQYNSCKKEKVKLENKIRNAFSIVIDKDSPETRKIFNESIRGWESELRDRKGQLESLEKDRQLIVGKKTKLEQMEKA